LLRYAGTNPATESNAMRTLIDYAINHQLRVEIAYGSSERDGHRIIEPFSEDLTMLYAFCQTRRGDRVFRLDKIFFARLTGERFQRSG
jgi:predicted DNA-binding transcriptional regulator YafY